MTLAPLSSDQLESVQALARLLDASFPCAAEDDLARVLWTKLLWNAPFNGVCALTRKNAGDVLAVPALEALIRGAMLEIVQVARSEGVDLGEHAIDAMLAITRAMFAETEPSMLQDVLAGRATETDALQGAVVVRGERHAVPTPIHHTLHALLIGCTHGP
jgi:2-dehydropantoate 2-reductase